ncbi:MAG: TIR domain-containing protein [Acidobacteria bacterium]|nr:MAG: TIR domain-containing protein [Acidobacteriota bacterium]
MPKTFVCHRREDTADVTGRIFDRLVMDYGGQQILKDLDSIPLGVDFREYLGRMVGECDVFLAVIGPRWLNAEGGTSRLEDARDFVRIEIESALAREIPIVPLFVGGASMPSEEDVPESIRSFVYRNGVPVRPDPDFHRDMDRVIAGLDGYGRPAPPPPAETATLSRAEPILPADPDSHHDAERERGPTYADRTLADELAAAQERHYAELARLEAEAAESRDIATRDAQARADATLAAEQRRVRAEVELAMLAARLATAEERHHAEIAHLETEAAENRDAATRDARARADTQAGPGRMGSGKRRDTAASDIETPQHHTGMPELPTPPMALTILIGAEDEVQTVESDPDFDTNIRVFADTDAIRALRCISRERPRVVVLGRAFVGTLRGAALVNGIKTDRTLANTQIRVIRRVSDYLCLVRRTDPQAASDDPMPGEPLPADYLGTREARRYKLRPGFEARIDGNPTTLVELSGRGAQLVGSTVLRMEQRVRLVMGTAPEVVRCSAIVVWVSFEPQGKRAPRYRAGTQFIDADPKAIQDLLRRHLRH